MCELLKINVSDHIEKKNNLNYLSWSFAWQEVLKIDPHAIWEVVEFDGLPFKSLPDQSAMVKVSVTIKGHTKACWLPVINHRNLAIKSPDAFAINTSIMRCMTKAVSMHGLGLYIYAGEDLPEGDIEESNASTNNQQQPTENPQHKKDLWNLMLTYFEGKKEVAQNECLELFNTHGTWQAALQYAKDNIVTAPY
jgi:hypothetical protein